MQQGSVVGGWKPLQPFELCKMRCLGPIERPSRTTWISTLREKQIPSKNVLEAVSRPLGCQKSFNWMNCAFLFGVVH